MSSRMVSPGFRRPTPTATAASDIFTRRQADVVRASRCIFLSVCFADVVPWRLGLILSVGRRAYRLYGVSPASRTNSAGNPEPGFHPHTAFCSDTQGNTGERKCREIETSETFFQIPEVQIIINIKYYLLNERTNLSSQ